MNGLIWSLMRLRRPILINFVDVFSELRSYSIEPYAMYAVHPQFSVSTPRRCQECDEGEIIVPAVFPK